MEERLLLAACPIIFANILFQSPGCQLPFLFAEPGRSSWEIWENKERCKGNHPNGCISFMSNLDAEFAWATYTVIAPSMMKSQRLTVSAYSIAHILRRHRTKQEDPLHRSGRV